MVFLLFFSRGDAVHEQKNQDDDEPVDPLTGIREKCGETKNCAAAMAQYKVRDNTKTSGERSSCRGLCWWLFGLLQFVVFLRVAAGIGRAR